MLLRGLDLLEDGGVGVSDTASMAFTTLSGRDSRSWSADRYIRGNRIEVVSEDDARLVRPTGVVGEAVYALAVARGGEYRLRLHVAGPEPAEAEIARFGEDEVLRTFVVPAEPVLGWIDAGTIHLDPGAYDTSVLLPEGATLEHVELAPPCLHPIEPLGGWKPTAITTTDDIAVTVLQALDMEYELPPAAAPLEYRGSDLQLEDGAQTVEATASPLTEGTFRGGPRGARVLLEAAGRQLPQESRLPRSRRHPPVACHPVRPPLEGPALLRGDPRARHRRRADPVRAEEGHPGRLRRHGGAPGLRARR
jgi:hypothetical protein